MDRPKWHRWIFTGINLVAFAVLLYVTSRFTNTGPKHVSYSEFLTELRADNLAEVQITERELIGVLKGDSSHPKPTKELTIKATRLPGVDESLLLKELEAPSLIQMELNRRLESARNTDPLRRRPVFVNRLVTYNSTAKATRLMPVKIHRCHFGRSIPKSFRASC